MINLINRYRAMLYESRLIKEDNDCSVITISLLTGLEYSHVRQVLLSCGRIYGRGATMTTIRFALKALGLKLVKVRVPKGLTTKNLAVKVNSGSFFVNTEHHVFALVDGTIIDWSIDRNLEILGVYKLQQVSKSFTTNRKTGVNKNNSLQVAQAMQ